MPQHHHQAAGGPQHVGDCPGSMGAGDGRLGAEAIGEGGAGQPQA
jgi:hypothetical protein